jgi:CubicO group peptidase (beta-lactamase class C family)
MRWARVVVTIGVMLLARVPLAAQDVVLNRLGDYFEVLRGQAGIPGLAAAVVGSNDILWERAFGYQDVARLVATRTDTPFHLDGVTQIVTATLTLRCVEEGRLSLDDRIGRFKANSPDANATLGQVLSHTSGPADSPVFAYSLERLEPLTRAIRACTDNSFRETVANLLERLAMIDSVPGPDIVHPELLSEGIPTPAAVERYKGALARLATPYSVDRRGNASPSEYAASTLTPMGGLMSSVHDLAQFDLAIKRGILLRPDSLALAWQPAAGADGQRLPHGLGWFVQVHYGETIVWQYGMVAGASSSLVVTLPARGITLILLANSDALAQPFATGTPNVALSPFVRLFVGLAVR